MTSTLKVGTILIEEGPRITQLLGLESEPWLGNWSVVKALDGFALDRKIHAAGWNFFFMAAEVKVMFFGALGTKKIQNALKRILAKVRHQNFNSLEVTGIVAKRFLGVPYATVSVFRTLTPYPTELLLGWRRGTADVPAQRRMGQRLNASPVRG